jgi:hypothetical protein
VTGRLPCVTPLTGAKGSDWYVPSISQGFTFMILQKSAPAC